MIALSAAHAARAAVGALALALAACAGNYTPPPESTTGNDAAILGRVFDLDVSLPHVSFDAGAATGVVLDVTLMLDTSGPGEHRARVVYNGARVSGVSEPIEDLSTGETALTESGTSWSTARLGPIRVRGVAFEYVLTGESAEGRLYARGDAWESQTGLGGSFEAWRRQRFLVATSDFSITGAVDLVEWRRDRALVRIGDVARASSDPVLRVTNGGAFVINRLGYDNVTRLDPGDGFKAAWQASTSPGSNPHDVILIDETKAYVTRYEPPFDDLAIISPKGGAARGTIDLSPFALNRDRTPRADRMARAAGLVFVGLQDIDRTFTRYEDGQLAVIDPVSDTALRAIALPGKNPGAMEVLIPEGEPARLYVALGGIYPGLLAQELSGGIALVDPVNLAFVRMVLDDDDAGGNIGALVMVDAALGYVVASDAAYVARVLAFDPESGEILREVARSTDLIPELEVTRGGLLAVPDRSFLAPRLCLYRTPRAGASGETLAGCVALSLPPFSIEALD